MGMILLIGLVTVGLLLYISNKTLPCGAKNDDGLECHRRKHKEGSHWALVQKNGHDTQIFWE